jgi:hypothetical protein
MRDKDGYVIGPDKAGRLSHGSSHHTLAEAKIYANKLNTGDTK